MISDQLKSMKCNAHITVPELSKLSGVPEQTLNRIFSGATTNPYFQTVADIVIALGGSLDDLAGIPPKRIDSTVNPEKYISLEHHRELLHEKDVWIERLFVFSTVMVGVVLLLLGHFLSQ